MKQGHRGKQKMVYAREVIDPTLAAVMAAIHKTAEVPAKGFLTREAWAKKWEISGGQARIYIIEAVKQGILVSKIYRITTQGRLMQMRHYGPPPRKGS